MKKIVVTNDDGLFSPGLHLLYEAVRGFGEVYVVAPMESRSAIGLGLTLHKPIRVSEVIVNGIRAYGINGTPSDAVHVAYDVVVGEFDLLLSGVNVGANLSLQDILASGTLGAAFEAAFMGIPAIAFSADVPDEKQFLDERYRRYLVESIRAIVEFFVEEGFPRGVDVVSVNFPRTISYKLRVVPPAKRRWKQKLDKRVDPRGRVYYWLYGEQLEPEPGTDVYTVLVEKHIAITPLTLSLTSPRVELRIPEEIMPGEK